LLSIPALAAGRSLKTYNTSLIFIRNTIMKVYKKAIKEILKKGWFATVYDDDNMLSDYKHCNKYTQIIDDIECCEIVQVYITDANYQYVGCFSVINDYGLDDDEYINDYTVSKTNQEYNSLMDNL